MQSFKTLRSKNVQRRTSSSKNKIAGTFFKPFVQAKLTINQPGDVYEQEADAVADRVMRMSGEKIGTPFFQPRSIPLTSVQKKCAHCEEDEKVQMKEATSVAGGITAPPVVNTVVNSKGQPLDAGTRNFMESRFGYDFGNVQIHNDASAHRSSAEINAQAYTHGDHVVFGAGHYQPQTNSGKQLLAHELAHVVQQKGSLNPVIRRRTSTAKSWAGKFVAANYDPFYAEGVGDNMWYGASIEIAFEPNKFVDAEKIIFVQTAQSIVDGTPFNIYEGGSADEVKASESRRTPDGISIDQSPTEITPVYGAQSTGAKLTDFTSYDVTLMNTHKMKSMEIGWRYGSVKPKNAKMADEPNLVDRLADNDGVSSSLEQRFESAAVAIAGRQKGTYYGSIEWGWKKNAVDTNPKLIDFTIKSGNAPGASFVDAANRWSLSKNAAGTSSIILATPELMKTRDNNTELKDDKRNTIAKLKRDTSVQVVSKFNMIGVWPDYNQVVVIDGSQKGKSGYIFDMELNGT